MISAGVGQGGREIGTGGGCRRRERLVVVAGGRTPRRQEHVRELAHRRLPPSVNGGPDVTGAGRQRRRPAPPEASAAWQLRAVRRVVRIPEPVRGELSPRGRDVLIDVSFAPTVIEPAGDLATPDGVRGSSVERHE